MGKLPDAAWAPGATIVRQLVPDPPEPPETKWRAFKEDAAKGSERDQSKTWERKR